jgi:hypothetical protein
LRSNKSNPLNDGAFFANAPSFRSSLLPSRGFERASFLQVMTASTDRSAAA